MLRINVCYMYAGWNFDFNTRRHPCGLHYCSSIHCCFRSFLRRRENHCSKIIWTFSHQIPVNYQVFFVNLNKRRYHLLTFCKTSVKLILSLLLLPILNNVLCILFTYISIYLQYNKQGLLIYLNIPIRCHTKQLI